jgi:hypothetical protein
MLDLMWATGYKEEELARVFANAGTTLAYHADVTPLPIFYTPSTQGGSSAGNGSASGTTTVATPANANTSGTFHGVCGGAPGVDDTSFVCDAKGVCVQSCIAGAGAGAGAATVAPVDPVVIYEPDRLAAINSYVNTSLDTNSVASIQALADAARQNGVSIQELAAATGYNAQDVQAVFDRAGVRY